MPEHGNAERGRMILDEIARVVDQSGGAYAHELPDGRRLCMFLVSAAEFEEMERDVEDPS